MSRNNDVFKVLVTSGNQAPLGVGNTVSDLNPGQIGVFDYDTNLSLNVGNIPGARDFYLAVGLDKDGDSVTDDIMKSSGSHIQKRNIRYYNFKPYTAGQAMQILISDYKVDCETEYGVKLEFNNSQIYRTQGYVQFTKAYSVVTSCCNGCEPVCPSGDCNELTKLLVENINNDPDGLVVAVGVARQNIIVDGEGQVTIPNFGSTNVMKGEELTTEQLDALIAYNAEQENEDKLCSDIMLTATPMGVEKFCSVNLKYFYPRQTHISVSKFEGFECNGNVSVITPIQYEQGKGYDLNQLEYEANGWNESPYRVSAAIGVANPTPLYAVASGNYSVLTLSYDEFSVGAWLEYLNNESTIIGIPTADTTTGNGLTAILNAAFPDFDPVTFA